MRIIRKIAIYLLLLNSCLLLSAQSKEDIINQLKNHVSGGQLVVYTQTSYIIKNTTNASSIMYVDFCPNGKYSYYNEGSFFVKDKDYNRTSGASYGYNHGSWDIVEFEKTYYLKVIDAMGIVSVYAININNLIKGKWKQNQTTYVFAPGTAKCNY